VSPDVVEEGEDVGVAVEIEVVFHHEILQPTLAGTVSGQQRPSIGENPARGDPIMGVGEVSRLSK